MLRSKATPLLFVLTLLHAGCGDDDDSSYAGECFSNDECTDGACFLGTCVDPGYGLGTVDIDVEPLQSNGPLRQRLSRVFDASSGAQDITLLPTLDIQGTVVRDGSPLDGSVRAYSTSSGICIATESDDVFTYDGVVTAGAVALQLVPDSYRLVFTPTDDSLPPIALPSDGSCGIAVADGARLDIAYPTTDLLGVSGRIRYSDNDSTGVAGAQVMVTSTNDAGAHFTSRTEETGSDGSFSLLLPPNGTTIDVQVKAGSNMNVPTLTFANVSRDAEGKVGELNLNVSAPVSVVVTVNDTTAAPLPDTTIVVQGSVGAGTYTTTAATSASGSVTLSLRAGTYTVVAVPRRAVNAGLTRAELVVDESTAGPRVDLTAQPKVAVSGTVYAADGGPIGNARVTYTLRDTETERAITTTTTSNGSYEVLLDTESPVLSEPSAEYEITVEPPAGSSVPRHRELTRVDSSTTTHDITLYAANYIYGTLRTNDGEPLAAASLLFYSRDGREKAVLLGVVQTTSVGEFTVPLPQP